MKSWIFCFFSLLSGFAFGQHEIKGIVTDEGGEGLIGAHVYLLKDWRNGTTTNVDGSFALTVDSMEDSLIVTYIGFKEVLLPLTSSMIIEMEAVELRGQEVIVTAKPLIAEEFKYQKINKIEIYTNPAAKADPILAVNSLPSSTTTDESANISLRGSSPVETTVFLNNVPVYDAVRYAQLNGIGTFSIFNTAIIKELTVFPGNPPLEFGNTTAGIISLSTDDRVLEENSNSAAISLANIGFTREQKLTKNQSLKVFSNWQPSGAIKALNEQSLEQIESFKSGDLGIYWYGSANKFNWKVLNYTVFEGYEFNFRHPSFSGIFDQNKKRSFLISTIERPVGKGVLTLNNGLSTSLGKYGYSNVKFRVDQKDFFGGMNYHISNQLFSVKTGLSFDSRNSEVDGSFHEYSYALGTDHPTISVSESANIKTAELFTYFKYYLNDEIAIGSGVRKNIPQVGQDSYLSRQVNLAYNNLPWTITLGAGTYHKNGLIENSGEPFTSKSRQESLDIKYQQDQYQFAFSLFHKNNELDSSAYTASGAELFIDYQLSSKLNISSSITWLDAKADNEENYAYDINYFIRGNLSYSPGRFWTVEAILVSREGSLINPVSGSVFDSGLDVFRPVYADDSHRLPDYHNLGVSISKMFPVSDKMNVIGFASLSNVLDSRNVRTYEYNFDYSDRFTSLFSRRTGYFGAVITF